MKEPYLYLCEDGWTIRFCYDEKKALRKSSCICGMAAIQLCRYTAYSGMVERVGFGKSFADYRLTSTITVLRLPFILYF